MALLHCRSLHFLWSKSTHYKLDFLWVKFRSFKTHMPRQFNEGRKTQFQKDKVLDLCETNLGKVTGKLARHCTRQQDSKLVFPLLHTTLPPIPLHFLHHRSLRLHSQTQHYARYYTAEVSLEHSSQFVTANAQVKTDFIMLSAFKQFAKTVKSNQITKRI